MKINALKMTPTRLDPSQTHEVEMVEICPVEGCGWRDDPPGTNGADIEVRGWHLIDPPTMTAHIVTAHEDLVAEAGANVKELFSVELWARYEPRR